MNVSERAITFLKSKGILLQHDHHRIVKVHDGTEFDIVELLHEFASQEITVLEMAMSLDGSENEEDKRNICNKVGLHLTIEQMVFECMDRYKNQK